MEATGEALCPDSDLAMAGPEPAGCAYFHKPVIALVMGSVMCAVGSLLFLLQSSGVMDESRSVASACLSIGLMFIVVGLVWIPILKEKQRRKRCTLGV